MYGFVVYYKVARRSTEIQTLQAFTGELVEYLISIKAKYYLCYGSYYTQSQLTTMYPEIRTLLALKRHYDPETLFTNEWYEKYRGGLSNAPILWGERPSRNAGVTGLSWAYSHQAWGVQCTSSRYKKPHRERPGLEMNHRSSLEVA